jgi:hypothetical protein
MDDNDDESLVDEVFESEDEKEGLTKALREGLQEFLQEPGVLGSMNSLMEGVELEDLEKGLSKALEGTVEPLENGDKEHDEPNCMDNKELPFLEAVEELEAEKMPGWGVIGNGPPPDGSETDDQWTINGVCGLALK